MEFLLVVFVLNMLLGLLLCGTALYQKDPPEVIVLTSLFVVVNSTAMGIAISLL